MSSFALVNSFKCAHPNLRQFRRTMARPGGWNRSMCQIIYLIILPWRQLNIISFAMTSYWQRLSQIQYHLCPKKYLAWLYKARTSVGQKFHSSYSCKHITSATDSFNLWLDFATLKASSSDSCWAKSDLAFR